MATDEQRRVVYWDTCVFLSLIGDEARQNSGAVHTVREETRKGICTVITSALTRAEILLSKNDRGKIREFDELFDSSNIKAYNVDYPIGEKTSEIRDHYIALSKTDTRPEVSLADAIHLATAIIYEVTEFHTFDEKDKHTPKSYGRGLLTLDGEPGVEGLKICRPYAKQTALDLPKREK